MSQKLGVALRLLLVSRTNIKLGKSSECKLFGERSCLKFFFLRFYGPGMLFLDFCFEGKRISKTARGSEVKIMQGYFWFQELPLA